MPLRRHSRAAKRNLESRASASGWIPAIHSTGVEPCGNDEAAKPDKLFNNHLCAIRCISSGQRMVGGMSKGVMIANHKPDSLTYPQLAPPVMGGILKASGTISPHSIRLSVQRVERFLESPGVRFFSAGQSFKPLCDVLKSFLASGSCEPGVHLGVLVGFPFNRRL